MSEREWIKNCKETPPPAKVEIETKIDDEKGIRNVGALIWDRMWWIPGMEMYVYYTPTHWRSK